MSLYPYLMVKGRNSLVNPFALVYVVIFFFMIFGLYYYLGTSKASSHQTSSSSILVTSFSDMVAEALPPEEKVEQEIEESEPLRVFSDVVQRFEFQSYIPADTSSDPISISVPPQPITEYESSIVDASTLPYHRLAASRVVVLPNVDLFGFDPAQSPDFCLDWDYGRSECLSMMNSGLDWRDYYEKAIACPIEFPLGAVVEVGLGDNHLYYTCLDRGSSVICDGGQCRFGILTHDLVSLPDFREVSIWIP